MSTDPLSPPPPPSKPQPYSFFSPLPPSPRQAKSPDNSNILHMFNNNTYTDFRTAYKHILIPNYVIQVI